MSGGCWNYMNDSAASEILGYHIYVGYGLDSDKHEKNYKQVVRDNPLGDPEISALVYDVFCLLHSYDWAESGDTDMDAYKIWNEDESIEWDLTEPEALYDFITTECK